MPLKLDHPRYHLGIFGGSGCGKTTFAVNFVKSSRARGRFLFDPEGQFARLFGVRPCRSGADIDRAAVSGVPVCFDPHDLFPGNLQGGLVFLALAVMGWGWRVPGRFLFVADEVGEFVTTSAMPAELKTLVQTGRRYGVDCVFIAQAPAELPDPILSQLTETVCFNLFADTEKTVKFLRKFRLDPAAVQSLPAFQWRAADKFGRQSGSDGFGKVRKA